MGATIRQDQDGVWVVTISGALRKEELDAIQATGAKGLSFDDNARVLVKVEENFLGWVGGEVWNDMTFFIEHGDQIAKIAIVGDPKWESRMLMFTAAGLRRAHVRYFAGKKVAEACAWLDERTDKISPVRRMSPRGKSAQ